MALDYTPLREKTLLNSLVAQPRVWDSALTSKDKLVVGRGCERDIVDKFLLPRMRRFQYL